MGKFSYKKRKGTRKQTFKNRKKIKKGGDPEAPTTETPPPTTETPVPTTETPVPTTETPAPTTETPAPATEAPAPTAETPAPTTEAPATERPAPTEAPAPTAETKEVQQNQNVTNSGSTAEGSYTSDDAGYQKFIENIKTNPEILNNVVFVNAGLSQIFLKQGNSWTEIKK